jgi:hypothetical protein
MNDAQDNDIPPAQSAHLWEQQEIIDRSCNALIYLKGGNHIILGDVVHNRITVAKGLMGPL